MKAEKRRLRFVLCLRTDGADDLESRKVYQVLPDVSAAREGLARIIDDSGEDYLYPAEYFVPVRLPAAASRQLTLAPARTQLPSRRWVARG